MRGQVLLSTVFLPAHDKFLATEMKNKKNKKWLYKWLVALVLMAPLVHAQTTLITESGREVIVHEDGSWEFASQDQFVTLPDGQRVRLNDDGSWIEDETTPPVQRALAPVQSRPFYSAVVFDVEELVIETRKEKVHKNTRTESNTVILISVEHDAGQTQAKTLTLNARDITLEDSSGTEYEILSVVPTQLTLQPGEEAYFEIRAYDSPGWRYGKHYEILLDAALTGTGEEVELEVPLSMAVNEQLEN